jgi:hypothetical protein
VAEVEAMGGQVVAVERVDVTDNAEAGASEARRELAMAIFLADILGWGRGGG